MTADRDTVRIFVAVGISGEARELLVDAVQRISSEVPNGIQWVRPEGMHLTLKFLGNIPAPRLPPLVECLKPVAEAARPFSLELAGLGMFPNRRVPRVLWAGADGDLEVLAELQRASESAITALGHPAEGRPFRPHITLGRPRRSLSDTQRARVGEIVSRTSPPSAVRWTVTSLEVMETELHPTGARHTIVVSHDFGG